MQEIRVNLLYQKSSCYNLLMHIALERDHLLSGSGSGSGLVKSIGRKIFGKIFDNGGHNFTKTQFDLLTVWEKLTEASQHHILLSCLAISYGPIRAVRNWSSKVQSDQESLILSQSMSQFLSNFLWNFMLSMSITVQCSSSEAHLQRTASGATINSYYFSSRLVTIIAITIVWQEWFSVLIWSE